MRPKLGRKRSVILPHSVGCCQLPHTAKGRPTAPFGGVIPLSAKLPPDWPSQGPTCSQTGRLGGGCVSKRPALTGTEPVEYPPRRGMTHPYLCSISIADNWLFSLCYLAGRRTLPRPCCLGAMSLSIAPPICLLISWMEVSAARTSCASHPSYS